MPKHPHSHLCMNSPAAPAIAVTRWPESSRHLESRRRWWAAARVKLHRPRGRRYQFENRATTGGRL